jgi:two-component system NtrC family response regulator
MQRIVEQARTAADTDASILLIGETGTGKEMLARAIHGASRRFSAPFAPVNCGALPRELVESELFGFRRGAFTGAYNDAIGLFASANGGTVFLDEIGEMPKDIQVKLLRVLQEKELRPVGSPRPIPVDVRIIAASNRSLAALRSEYLRDDFYFRIVTVTLELPPLRNRPEDLLALVRHFTRSLAERYQREVTLSRSALELLLHYSFPGNIRELMHVLESLAALSRDDPQVITERELRPLLESGKGEQMSTTRFEPILTLEQWERVVIERALRQCKGNRTHAASLLGISRDTLHRKLREFKETG